MKTFEVQGLLRDFLFRTDLFEFSCPAIRQKDITQVRKLTDPTEWKGSIEVSLQNFLDVARVVVGVTYSLDLVSIETQGGRLMIRANTKTGRRSLFPVQEGFVSPFTTAISSDFLKKLILLLSTATKRGMGDILKIRVGSDGRVVYNLGPLEIISGAIR